MPYVIKIAIIAARNIDASFTPVPEETVTSANPRNVLRLTLERMFKLCLKRKVLVKKIDLKYSKEIVLHASS